MDGWEGGWMGGWVVGFTGNKTNSAPKLDWGLGLSFAKCNALATDSVLSTSLRTIVHLLVNALVLSFLDQNI